MTETPGTLRTLAEAARELQALLRAQRARQKAAADRALLDRLEAQSARRSANAWKGERPPGGVGDG